MNWDKLGTLAKQILIGIAMLLAFMLVLGLGKLAG